MSFDAIQTDILLQEIRDEMKNLRREVAEVMILCFGTFERVRRLESHLEETRNVLETKIKTGLKAL